MTLREKQVVFLRMVADLIIFIHNQGYEATGGDLYRDPRSPYGRKRSAHKQRLAIDLNLFKDGVFLTDSEDYEPIGLFWESIGGTWGGRFKSPDGNHFSLEFDGIR